MNKILIISRTIWSRASDLEAFAKSLAKGYRLKVVDEPKEPFLAQMQHELRIIRLNVVGFMNILEPFSSHLLNLRDDSAQREFVYKFACGLILHEVGHVKYTPPSKRVDELVQENNIKSPKWWYHFCVNVVDDSFIQNKMRQDYPGNFVNECLSYVEVIVQGQEAAAEFFKLKEINVQQSLFFLILLSYNRTIDKPDTVKISDELIDEFLSIYYVDSDEERIILTLQFADKLMLEMFDQSADELAKKLKITITNKPQPPGFPGMQPPVNEDNSDTDEITISTDPSQQQGGTPMGDIDIDKYDEVEVEYDIDPTLPPPQQNPNDDEEEDDSNMPGVGGSESSDIDIDELDGDSESSGNGDGDSEDEGEGDGDAQGANGEAGEDGDSSTSDQPGKGIGTGSQEPIGQGSKDLNAADVFDYMEKMVDSLSDKDLTTSEGEADKNDLSNNSVLDRIVIGSNMENTYNSSKKLSLNNFASDLTKSFNVEFKRIQAYTFNRTVYNLPTGKFNSKDAFRTSFTKNVFSQRFEPKREMDLFCGIDLDCSGSMLWQFDGNPALHKIMTDVIQGLLDSLTQVKAKTEVLGFDDRTIKLKDYYAPYEPESYYAALKDSADRLGGGTAMLDSLNYFKHAFRLKKHKDKALIIFTDGATNELRQCAEIISELTKQNVLVVGIGLNLRDRDEEYFESLFQDVKHKNYEGINDIKINIAKDLREILSETFMKNKI